MKYKIVMLEPQLAELRGMLFDRPGVEGAAFLLCGQSCSGHVNKLIVHAVLSIASQDFLRREVDGLSISSAALMRISKLAKYEGLSVIFAHSHPQGIPDFSDQDDREEERLLPFLQSRLPDRIHGTLVLTEEDIRGRLYVPQRVPVDMVSAVGQRFRSWTGNIEAPSTQFFDRQIRAFGRDIQGMLTGMHVGVVGLGGTGSPLAEQLCRLGVGHLSLFDGDKLEVTNVNRVFGSRVTDDGRFKVDIAKQYLEGIGLGTKIDAHAGNITEKTVARILPDCDIVFGCTDKELPRAILVQLVLRYSIPVLDLGVLIDSQDGSISGVHGRVTTLLPGEACLFCRGRISAEAIRVEALSDVDRQSQARDGYAPELGDPAPAVIAFTSATASTAVSELLHRLTGFMGKERVSTEVLLAFDQSRVRTNRILPREHCMCGDQASWGRGDTEPFLDLVWPTPQATDRRSVTVRSAL